MKTEQLELIFLRQAVEQKAAMRLATSADFAHLSEEMDERVSASTLKRIWGYVGMIVEPRRSTLDALARYAGFRDYRAFHEDLLSSKMASSGYFNADRLDSSSLQEGDIVSIGWRPDRVVTLKYLGDRRFVVVSSSNSKLMEGDEFEARSIVKGFPLVLPEVVRNGEKTSSFIAGRDGGIVFIKTD
ncbi:MAG: hypothetical protein IJL61_07525 [Bacteroidales bacterium]|nr:hypothetical protein [Bacteroidales bacterium]